MSFENKTVEDAIDASASAFSSTASRQLPSRRLSVAPMMDWTEEVCFS
jgi:hypothetical protein